VLREYEDYRSSLRPAHPAGMCCNRCRWMLEELRISTFAQELGTAYPVSDVRIYRTLATIP
jgi:ATP-dependent helicase HrpA